MKKIYLLIVCFFTINAFGQSLWDSTYYGNGKTGFGGTIGQGSIKIDFHRDSVYFTLTRGPGALNDVMVLYLQTGGDDPEDIGYSSTANFTDDTDGLRRAISGFSGSGRSVLKFANGFMPNAAIAFNSDFAGAFELRENGPHQFIFSANLRPSGDKNASEYTFAIPFNDGDENGDENTFIGRIKKVASGKEEFRFIVTYISETGFRSNEFVGDIGPTNNPGFSEYEATAYAVGYSPSDIEYEKEYFGNNKDGFGGAIGNGNLRIKVKNDSLFYILRKGNGDFNDIVVIYAQGNVPSHPTGISSTANFTDVSSAFTKAISGFDGTNRSVLTFANKFKPDVAFVIDKTHASMYELVENGAHIYIGEMSFRIKTYSPYDVDYIAGFKIGDGTVTTGELEQAMSELGLLVNYVRADGYRSNEFIGDPGPDTNPGWGDYISTTFIGDTDPVPVTLLNFQGITHNNEVNLQWKTSQESNIDVYEILRSADGKNFSKIGFVKANNLDVEQVYSYQDANPLSGDNFYKLGIVSKDGQVEFSKIISIKAAVVNNFKAYTTASNKVLKIELNSPSKENWVVEMTNSAGQKIFKSQLKPNGSNNYSINLNTKLAAGIYSVIISGNGETFSKMIMVK